jgi:hypothetical protein
MLAAFDPGSTFTLDNHAVEVAALQDQDKACYTCVRLFCRFQGYAALGGHTTKVMEFVSCTQQWISAGTMQQTCTEVRSGDEFQQGHEWRRAAPSAVVHRAFQRYFIAVPRSGNFRDH